MPAAFSFNTSGQSFVFFFFIPFFLFFVLVYFIIFFVFFFRGFAKATFVGHSAAHLKRPVPKFVKGFPSL